MEIWEGWFVGTIITFNKTNVEYTISFDGFEIAQYRGAGR